MKAANDMPGADTAEVTPPPPTHTHKTKGSSALEAPSSQGWGCHPPLHRAMGSLREALMPPSGRDPACHGCS